MTSTEKKHNRTIVFFIFILLAIAPLVVVKVTPFFNINSYLGFLGISYLTFKSVQTVMEIRDGVLKNFNFWFFYNFWLSFQPFHLGQLIDIEGLRKIIIIFLPEKNICLY